MKRIAILVPGTISKDQSSTYIASHVGLVKRLSERFEIVVYSSIKGDGDTLPFRCGNAVVRFIPARFDENFFRQYMAFLRAFRRDHERKPFSVVHGFRALPAGLCAVMLGRKWNIPSVVSLQGGEAAALSGIGYGNMRKQPLRSLTLWTSRRATYLTALTRFQMERLRDYGLLRDDARIIPYGATNNFYYLPRDKRLSSGVHFLHVGQLSPVKDQMTLLRAFKIIASRIDCRLRIVGDDLMNRRIQRFATDLALDHVVEFAGFVRHDKLYEHYRWAHCLLHSSRYEGQGVVVAEAAASGIPACGTLVGLIADLAPRAAIGVPVGDYTALADAACSLVGDDSRYQTVRQNAYTWAVSHRLGSCADQFTRIYEGKASNGMDVELYHD